MNLAKQAQKLYSKSAVLELDRSNLANSTLIQKYRLAGAPIPFIIVIGTNGTAVGGAPLQGLTADAIVKMVPTPKLADLYKFIGEGNPVILVFSKKTFKDKKETLKECNNAITLLIK